MRLFRAFSIFLLLVSSLFSEQNKSFIETKKMKFEFCIPRQLDAVHFKTLPIIAVDNLGNVFGVDNLMHTVYKFDKNGNLLQQIGKKGEGPGDFYLPIKIAIHKKNLFVKDNIAISIFDINGKFINRFRIFWSIVSFSPCEELIFIVSGDFERLVNVFDKNGNLLGSFGNKYNIDYSLYKGWPESFVSERIHHGKILCDQKNLYFVSFLFGELFKYDFKGNFLNKWEAKEIDLSKENKKLYFKKGIKLNERWEFSPWQPVFSDAYICDESIYLLLSPFFKEKIEIWQLNTQKFEINRKYLLEASEKISIADKFAVSRRNGEEIFYIFILYDDYFAIGVFK